MSPLESWVFIGGLSLGCGLLWRLARLQGREKSREGVGVDEQCCDGPPASWLCCGPTPITRDSRPHW